MVGAVADARDAVQALVNGDLLGAALNAAGAIPGPGDGAKVANVVGLFIKKNPDKIIETAIVMMVVFKKFAPKEVNLGCLDKIFDGAATALKDKGIS
ncbi:MAG: hypothetical protein SCH39_13675, partial [Methanosarcinales archaeon]|nr:hypothetical protein [Methanosarcinales archaeon]